jgi:tetrahydromethanopterin S-methyltransferase subunit A
MLAGKSNTNNITIEIAAKFEKIGIHKYIPNIISNKPDISFMNFLLVRKGGIIL